MGALSYNSVSRNSRRYLRQRRQEWSPNKYISSQEDTELTLSDESFHCALLRRGQMK